MSATWADAPRETSHRRSVLPGVQAERARTRRFPVSARQAAAGAHATACRRAHRRCAQEAFPAAGVPPKGMPGKKIVAAFEDEGAPVARSTLFEALKTVRKNNRQ
jgi:hypothetical protein